jgi:hypothetical protein
VHCDCRDARPVSRCVTAMLHNTYVRSFDCLFICSAHVLMLHLTAASTWVALLLLLLLLLLFLPASVGAGVVPASAGGSAVAGLASSCAGQAGAAGACSHRRVTRCCCSCSDSICGCCGAGRLCTPAVPWPAHQVRRFGIGRCCESWCDALIRYATCVR